MTFSISPFGRPRLSEVVKASIAVFGLVAITSLPMTDVSKVALPTIKGGTFHLDAPADAGALGGGALKYGRPQVLQVIED